MKKESLISLFVLIIFLITSTAITAQSSKIDLKSLEVKSFQSTEVSSAKAIYFDGAVYLDDKPEVPLYFSTIELQENEEISASMKPVALVALAANQAELLKAALPLDFEVKIEYGFSGGSKYAYVYVVPFSMQNGVLNYCSSFELNVESIRVNRNRVFKSSVSTFASNSVLSNGWWYKLSVEKEGMHVITPKLLSDVGLSLTAIDVNNIAVFGNEGGMLPEENSAIRQDDLQELNIELIDQNNDGLFNGSDQIRFYAHGPHRWRKEGSGLRHEFHRYDEKKFYFVTVKNGPSNKINSYASPTAAPNLVMQTFNDYQFHESELTNLISSGRNWYGEPMGVVNAYDFKFNFDDVVLGSNVEVLASVVGRSTLGASSFSVAAEGQQVSQTIPAVPNDYSAPIGVQRNALLNYAALRSLQEITVSFSPPTSEARAWIDFIEVKAQRNIVFRGSPLKIINETTPIGDVVEVQMNVLNTGFEIWRVSNHNKVEKVVPQLNGSSASFRYQQQYQVEEFYVFSTNQPSFEQPVPVSFVPNQNLHALQSVNYLVITHPSFLAQANRIAEFHKEKEGLSAAVVNVFDIYNEFSGGAQDITAIKDLARMLYWRGKGTSDELKYLLLFGDASFDYKSKSSSNTNFVPTFESVNSIVRSESYLTDDYFGLMDSTESSNVGDRVDIGIGRFTVRNTEEANAVVEKSISYYDENTKGAWRNFISFIGDDEDGNTHMRDADSLALRVENQFPNYNIDKIYFDAYRQVSTPGGNRYPDVEVAFNNRVQRGALILSYLGHGGVLGLAHERVLEIEDINRWTNGIGQPLFVTATCEFTRFDDPKRTSAGEYVFLNPDGGGIGLLTTTRLVYAAPNYRLAREFNDIAYDRIDGETPTMGDLCRITKAKAPGNINSRCFSLIGDPALKLAYPQLRVETTSAPDSIRPLEKVTFSGIVTDINGVKQTDFNGVIQPTVFDKVREVTTLQNDGQAAFKFKVQNSVIFRGRASVKNGEWTFSFVAPKDIALNTGQGRVSYYAYNGAIDATGFDNDLSIGGLADTNRLDNTPPLVELFMNDESFVNGGITNRSPLFLAKVFDENGINTSGNGIGHDIVAILDGNSANPIVLNDFYESAVDSFQRGEVRYQLKDLAVGTHTIRFTIWDVFNNPSTAEIEFVVKDDEKIAIDNVLNYPNPFTTSTWFMFDHNQPLAPLDVRLQIFTVAGKLIKTIDQNMTTSGFKSDRIFWDATDDFGDKIARGVYIYKLRVRNQLGETVEKFEKIYLL